MEVRSMRRRLDGRLSFDKLTATEFYPLRNGRPIVLVLLL